MHVTYELDASSGLIETRCRGCVRLDDVMDHFRRLESDPRLPERLDVLLDLAAVTSIPDSNQLRHVAGAIARLETMVDWGAFAIVAPQDVLFGMSRMLEVFSEGSFARIRVFRHGDEARRWLETSH